MATYYKAKINRIEENTKGSGLVHISIVKLYYVSEDGWDLYDIVHVIEDHTTAENLAAYWRNGGHGVVQLLLEQKR